jgi:hypothetical protein
MDFVGLEPENPEGFRRKDAPSPPPAAAVPPGDVLGVQRLGGRLGRGTGAPEPVASLCVCVSLSVCECECV